MRAREAGPLSPDSGRRAGAARAGLDWAVCWVNGVPLAGEARWQPYLTTCSAFRPGWAPSPGYSMQPVTRPERRYPRLSGSCLVDPVTPQELRTVRLSSSRCNATPAAWWSWPVRHRANARTAAAREGQDLRSRGYYTATSSTTTASGLSYSSSGISRSAAMTTVSASCSRAYCTRSSRLAG